MRPVQKSCLIVLLGASGCMNAARPPSLAPRAIEQRADAVAPAPVAPVARPIDAALASRIAALRAEAREGDALFAQAERAGASAIRAGAASRAGSEQWLAGEQARSAMIAARQRTAAALAAIDTLLTDQAAAAADGRDAGGIDEIRAAQDEIDALVSRQTARLEALPH